MDTFPCESPPGAVIATSVHFIRRGTAPQPWELEQLVHIPHCGNCGKAPATVVCKICHFYGYCSEACLEAQKSHRNSWQCFQVGATAVVMSFLQKAGSAYPFLTMQETGEVPESVYRSGWQEFVAYSKLVGRDGKEFQTMPPAAQQTVIDALSFPLSVLEACWVANHSFVRKHIKVHILNPFGSTLADLVKYEEWFHRCPDVITLELHFIGTEVIVPAAAVDSCLELALCESCSSKSRKMTCHFHTCPLLEFIEEEIAAGSPPPFLRVAYSTAFGRLPAEAAVPWTAALTRLAERPDAAPLVVTERVFCDAGQDEEMLRNCGWRTVVPPRCCRFPSPLVSRDDIRDCEDNPIGLSIWNMSWAVFKAGAVPTDEEEEPPKDVGSEQTKVKSASQSEVEVAAEIFIAHKALESPDACSIGERVLNERMQWGTVTGKRCCGFPDSVEVVLDSGVRKHFLPDELLPVPSDVVAKPAPLPQLPLLEDPSCYRLLVQHPGPWRYDGKTKEDVAFNPEANPDSFVVSVSACCEGGRGFRSPLTSRNDKPSSGYVFYADGEDQWEFWVGDGDYWCGVQGPPVEQKWTELVGLYDAELRSVAFFVDGTCAGVRSGVDFRPNTLCPLRIGAGRSENEFARYYWTGSVRDIKIYQILPKSDS
ncbi:unnamed protein product [Effrenium voratum]|nr:unnamed protein product [Effrenium voratum]